MDMKLLFDDFMDYVNSMSSEDIIENICNAIKHTSDCKNEEQLLTLTSNQEYIAVNPENRGYSFSTNIISLERGNSWNSLSSREVEA